MINFQISGASVLASALAVLALSAPSFASELTAELGGRVQIDYTNADIDTPDSSINDTELRRARLHVIGAYGSSVKYKIELNKASGSSVNVEDAYLQFTPEGSRFKIKAGQFKTHNSLDEQTSSRFISTLERAAFTDAFAFDRRVGLSVGTSGDNYTFDAGVFTTNLEENGGTDEGHAVSARGTFNPIKTDDMLVHLGASWRYRSKGDTASELRYRQRPYTHVAPSRIIDTGRFAKSDNFLGVEAAVIAGQFWAAGEYGLLGANGNGANSNADFGGFYGEAGVFFGGARTYKGGKFNRPKVDKPLGEGGYGALALVARYDQIDLQDGVYIGELDTMIIGADWYPIKYTRIGLNYFDSDATNGTADKGRGFTARLQFDF
ncbi:MAG: OprO/OprP family phosphate-selective porin [Alphaproteobacteria bacterium]